MVLDNQFSGKDFLGRREESLPLAARGIGEGCVSWNIVDLGVHSLHLYCHWHGCLLIGLVPVSTNRRRPRWPWEEEMLYVGPCSPVCAFSLFRSSVSAGNIWWHFVLDKPQHHFLWLANRLSSGTQEKQLLCKRAAWYSVCVHIWSCGGDPLVTHAALTLQWAEVS